MHIIKAVTWSLFATGCVCVMISSHALGNLASLPLRLHRERVNRRVKDLGRQFKDEPIF
jgi:hypothetical protein